MIQLNMSFKVVTSEMCLCMGSYIHVNNHWEMMYCIYRNICCRCAHSVGAMLSSKYDISNFTLY